MTLFLALVLALLTFIFIAFPFYRRRAESVEVHDDGQVTELLSKRNTSYSMLKELEFDYKSGILAEKDYHELEANYKKQAINILKELDGAHDSQKIADEIEEHVKQLRLGKAGDSLEDLIEREVKTLRHPKSSKAASVVEKQATEPPQEMHYCRKCGAKTREGDRFCFHCGANLA